jgi:uncharacterized OsmC-like protein
LNLKSSIRNQLISNQYSLFIIGYSPVHPNFIQTYFMDASALRALQAPFKEQYRNNPDAALITLKAKGNLGEHISCKVETGRALVEAGLHPATGGNGLLACSGDMLLEALVACAGVTLQAVATAIGIEIKNGSVSAEGDLDFRGTLGVSKEAAVGFRDIRLDFFIDSNATEEQMQSLAKLTERYCVVYQTLVKGVTIASRFHSGKE